MDKLVLWALSLSYTLLPPNHTEWETKNESEYSGGFVGCRDQL